MARQPTLDLYQLEYLTVRARNRLHFRWAARDDRDAFKLFVAGHPRTGTGTLHRIFKENGLDSTHTAGAWKTARYDCFSDRGNYQPFEQLDGYYRNALFLLNTRPAYNYVKSRASQTIKKRTNHGMMQPRFTARHAANEILRRNNHFLAFVRHFLECDNALVANIERPGAFDFICERLDLEREQEVWSNKSRMELPADKLALIDEGFRRLGVPDERLNPFIIRPLLNEAENRMVDEFLERHADRVYL